MSSSATPISHARFSSAIKDLPLGNLYSSAAELRNSIAHLRSSNEQLGPFASGEDADQDCVDAIKENEEVIERMVARIEILKREVEGRGYKWVEPEEEEEEEEEEGVVMGVVNGHVGVGVGDGDGEVDEEEDEGQDEEEEENNSESRGGPARTDAATARTGSHHGGSIGDEELRRLVEERLLHGDNNNNDDDDGGLDL